MRTTAHNQVLGGIPCTIPNRTDEVETGSPHWYVSYNNRDTAEYGSDTTALVLGQMECFFVLNGDHREGLKACIASGDFGTPALVRCLAYLREHVGELNLKSDPFV